MSGYTRAMTEKERAAEHRRRVAELVAEGLPRQEAEDLVTYELRYEGDLLPRRASTPAA